MAASRQGQSEALFRSGLRELARHRPDRALHLLRSAVEACPALDSALLARRLYWLSIAQLRLDRPELALKSLATATKLRPRAFCAAAYALRSNEYGLPRRSCPDVDDFYAFFSIQTCLFLATRPGQRFSSEDEKDNVTRLIAFAWQALKQSGRMTGLSSREKLALFRGWPKVFPDFLPKTQAGPSKPAPGCGCETIFADFAHGGRITGRKAD
jgi:hypothetical protein